jgi:hypothetical protein
MPLPNHCVDCDKPTVGSSTRCSQCFYSNEHDLIIEEFQAEIDMIKEAAYAKKEKDESKDSA